MHKRALIILFLVNNLVNFNGFKVHFEPDNRAFLFCKNIIGRYWAICIIFLNYSKKIENILSTIIQKQHFVFSSVIW